MCPQQLSTRTRITMYWKHTQNKGWNNNWIIYLRNMRTVTHRLKIKIATHPLVLLKCANLLVCIAITHTWCRQRARKSAEDRGESRKTTCNAGAMSWQCHLSSQGRAVSHGLPQLLLLHVWHAPRMQSRLSRQPHAETGDPCPPSSQASKHLGPEFATLVDCKEKTDQHNT